jgi:DNA polymerase IV (DinB-like DNA polymerase)
MRGPGVDASPVLHVDVDCFYAACERLREPALRGEPVVVGMGYESGAEHGAVATASYEAREHGVESAQAISEAVERLPPARYADDHDGPVGHYRPVDMEYYESVAAEVKEVLHGTAETVRAVSVDEAYLDPAVSWEGVEPFARELKAAVADRAGVTASVGVAPNMSAAKVASDHDKPDGFVLVRPGEVREFLAPLAVEELHGVGPVTARDLRSTGITIVGDVAAADRDALVERFGERGREIHDRARGRDDREVEPVGDPKSLNRESAFTEATDDRERVRERVRDLAADVCERATERGALYKTIGVKVVVPPFDVHTRARSLSGHVHDPDLVETVALDLLAEFEGTAVRKLGVRVANLSFAGGDQASLDGWAGEGDGAEGEPTDGGRSARDRHRRTQTTIGEFDARE